MPNPKRRHSKQRTAKRRSHDFLTPVSTSGDRERTNLCDIWSIFKGAGWNGFLEDEWLFFELDRGN